MFSIECFYLCGSSTAIYSHALVYMVHMCKLCILSDIYAMVSRLCGPVKYASSIGSYCQEINVPDYYLALTQDKGYLPPFPSPVALN